MSLFSLPLAPLFLSLFLSHSIAFIVSPPHSLDLDQSYLLCPHDCWLSHVCVTSPTVRRGYHARPNARIRAWSRRGPRRAPTSASKLPRNGRAARAPLGRAGAARVLDELRENLREAAPAGASQECPVPRSMEMPGPGRSAVPDAQSSTPGSK